MKSSTIISIFITLISLQTPASAMTPEYIKAVRGFSIKGLATFMLEYAPERIQSHCSMGYKYNLNGLSFYEWWRKRSTQAEMVVRTGTPLDVVKKDMKAAEIAMKELCPDVY